jgi:membrane protease YdiL (CAAX protease family)
MRHGPFILLLYADGVRNTLVAETQSEVPSIPERRPQDDAPRTARGWVLLASPLVAVALFAALVLLGSAAAVFVIRPTPTKEQIRSLVRALPQHYDAQMGLTILIYLSVLLSIWLLLPKRGPASLQSYFRPVSWKSFSFALFSGILFAILIGSTLAYLSERHVISFHLTDTERAMMPQTPAQLGVGLAAIAIVGPLVEEVYFRGLLLRWLQLRLPLAVAAIPNAALFAAIHFRFSSHAGPEGWVLTAGLFVFGLFASAWAGTMRSVWPSFAAHGMYNATLISLPVISASLH